MRLSFALVALTALAGASLAACDQATELGKAEVGDCYRIVGEDSLGAPKLEKADCAQAGAVAEPVAAEAASATATPPATQTASTAAACPAPAAAAACACPQTACAAPAATKTAVASTRSYVATSGVRPKVAAGSPARSRRQASSSTSRRTAVREEVQDYAYTGDGAYADNSSAYDVYGSDIGRYGESRGSSYQQREDYAASQGRYDQQRVYSSAPPPVQYGYQGGHASGVSVTSSESSSGYASSSSQGYAQGYGQSGGGYAVVQGGPCCAQGPGGLRGPNTPFDRNGFLTWPGKR